MNFDIVMKSFHDNIEVRSVYPELLEIALRLITIRFLLRSAS